MITEKVCYHDSRHHHQDNETGWCIACLIDLYDQGEIWFLSTCVQGSGKSVTPAAALRTIAARLGCDSAAGCIATLKERYGKVAKRVDAGFTRRKPRGFGRGRNRHSQQRQQH